ncbi:GCN5 family acetyltransferase [Alcaligenes faecalis]|nr:GCN5 family acetyltransferase [Alcaligenes faecalis]
MEAEMDLDFQWKRLDDLSTREMYTIIQAREAVFVVEQACAYQEVDGLDLDSWHLSVLKDGELAAYARVVEPGLKYEEPSIGRVLTLAKFRSLKIGYALVAEAIRFTETHYPGTGIRIGAQAHLQKFYGSLGFEPVGEIYDEDGIAHIDMVKAAVIA